ncbi:MAG: hypoxanthine phosphoribosyltransferase [Chitinophagales bacterium]
MPQLKNKFFKPLIAQEQILKRTAEIAMQINTDYKDQNPLIIGVLNGAYRFLGELSNHIDIPCEVSFVRLKSYRGMKSGNKVNELLSLPENINGRKIIVVEDIVDSGKTLQYFLPQLKNAGADSVEICTLLLKPKAFQFDYRIKYTGFEIENDFVVGYGLDYDGAGRCWNDICKLESNPKKV